MMHLSWQHVYRFCQKPAMVFLLVLLAYSYTQAQDDTILAGTWTVDFTQTVNRMSESEKARYDSMPTEARTNMQNAFNGRTFAFNENNAIIIRFAVLGQVKEATGTWSYDADLRKLIITLTGTDRVYEVVWEGTDHIQLIYKTVDIVGALSSLSLVRN